MNVLGRKVADGGDGIGASALHFEPTFPEEQKLALATFTQKMVARDGNQIVDGDEYFGARCQQRGEGVGAMEQLNAMLAKDFGKLTLAGHALRRGVEDGVTKIRRGKDVIGELGFACADQEDGFAVGQGIFDLSQPPEQGAGVSTDTAEFTADVSGVDGQAF